MLGAFIASGGEGGAVGGAGAHGMGSTACAAGERDDEGATGHEHERAQSDRTEQELVRAGGRWRAHGAGAGTHEMV